MEIGKFNLTFLIKSVAIGFYLVYFIIFNSSLNIYLPEYKNYDTTIKKELISNKCFLIIGGSNARQGISAKIISENVCPALNLSINNEMENFSLYKNWLFNNLKDKEFK